MENNDPKRKEADIPGDKHCPVSELLQDNAKLNAWKKKFEGRNIKVATLSCDGNPVHADARIALRDAQSPARAKSTISIFIASSRS